MSFSFQTPQQQQQSPFSFQTPQQQQPSPFQINPFSQQSQQVQPQQQQVQPQFQFSQPQQLQQQQQQQQLFLFTVDKTPASYSTKWAELHPDSQKFLLQVEERILEYRDESQRLDQCSRLYDLPVSNDGFEIDASHMVQELGGISTSMERQKAVLQELMAAVKDMLRNTEVAIRSFMMLRPRFLHQNAGAAATATTPAQPSGATMPPTSVNQQTGTSIVPVFDFYSGLPKKPSPFLQHTVARFEMYIAECHQLVEELEQLILFDSDKNSSTSSSLLQSLPKVMSNVHDFFVHIAAKVESIHQYIESMKTAYLADQRRRGDGNDPFLEADRRETAKLEVAARRVHPTLHLPAVSQPATQVSGLLTRSAAPAGAPTVPQTSAVVSSASLGSGSSLLVTPPIAAGPSSLFSTPSTSAAVSSLFGSSGAPTQPSLFGPLSSSTQALSSNPLFGSTPASAVSNFSNPFASGPATVSSSSFNAQKPRVKSRTGRR